MLEILHTPVNALDYAAACLRVANQIDTFDGQPEFIVQANVYSLVSSFEQPSYRQALTAAYMVVPDGMPLVWILKAHGMGKVERVYGPDFMLMLCEKAAKEGWRCFFYGGLPGIPELLKERLVARFPGLIVVGTYSPPFRDLDPEEDKRVCAMINSAKPDILWVGLGSPKQDIWMYEHLGRLDVAVMHGVGAAFDFITGRIRQAPRWMMNVGLEWLFRLIQEPRRLWRRYTIANVKFVYYLYISWLRKRR